ncbi:translation initiation factor IF-2-like [Dermochelys coriacea]|uniref:translation initiation factor IF-2-like n=1 Tax=Dermochelys coriacea TaxID=27794 RepID=UPI001CA9C97B|nr:translation initiation factor IF-2-like [Dermochelys coriacea]
MEARRLLKEAGGGRAGGGAGQARSGAPSRARAQCCMALLSLPCRGSSSPALSLASPRLAAPRRASHAAAHTAAAGRSGARSRRRAKQDSAGAGSRARRWGTASPQQAEPRDKAGSAGRAPGRGRTGRPAAALAGAGKGWGERAAGPGVIRAGGSAEETKEGKWSPGQAGTGRSTGPAGPAQRRAVGNGGGSRQAPAALGTIEGDKAPCFPGGGRCGAPAKPEPHRDT